MSASYFTRIARPHRPGGDCLMIRHVGAFAIRLALLGFALLSPGCDGPAMRTKSPGGSASLTNTAALERRVSVDFRSATLPDVLDELSRQARVRVYADEGTIAKEHGVQPETWRITLRLTDVRLESAIRIIADEADLALDPRADGIAITTPKTAAPVLESACYPIPTCLIDPACGFDEQALAHVVQSLVAPASWERNNGPGHVRAMPGALVVIQTPANQRQVVKLLSDLRRCAEENVGSSEVVDDVRNRSAPEIAIERALSETVTMEVRDRTVATLLNEIAEAHEINVTCDVVHELAPLTSLPINLTVTNVPLRVALRQALAQLNLSYVVRNEALLVSFDLDEPDRFTWAIYPVSADIPKHWDQPVPSLVEAVDWHIARGSWAEVGGSGSVHAVPGGLAVYQNDVGHARVARFLAGLERASDPRTLEESKLGGPAPSGQGLEPLLDRPVTFDCRRSPLRTALANAAASIGIGNIVVDDDALEEMGVMPDDHFPIALDGVSFRCVLDLLEDVLRVATVIDGDSLIVTSSERAEDGLETRFYRRPLLVGPPDPIHWTIADIVENHVWPEAWIQVGGGGSLTVTPPLLFVTQDRRTHRRIRTLLNSLDEMVSRRTTDPATPLPVDSPSQVLLHAALRQPTTINASDQRLDVVLADLASRHGLTGRYLIDARALGGPDTWHDFLVSAELTGAPLSEALDALLQPVGLDWELRDEVLFVSTMERLTSDGETRLYPVPLLPTGQNGIDPYDFGELMSHCVDYESWDEVGGPGRWTDIPGGLVVTHARPTHLHVAVFLEQLSRIVADKPLQYRAAYAVGLPDPADMTALVHDVRPLLRPQGPFAAAELCDLVAGVDPYCDAPARPTILAGALLAGSDPPIVARRRELLMDTGGCLTRVIAMRNAPDNEALASCRAALADPCPIVRTFALQAVAQLGLDDSQIAPILVGGLRDQDRYVQRAAVMAIHNRNTSPLPVAAGPLAELLIVDDHILVSEATLVLIEYGPQAAEALPVLRRHIDAGDLSFSDARPVLVAIGPKAAPLVGDHLHPPQGLAYDILNEMGPDAAPAVPQIQAALRQLSGPHHIECLCRILTAIGPAAEAAIPELLAIANRNDAVAEVACETLGELNLRPDIVVPALVELAADRRSLAVSRKACAALAQFGGRAAPALPALEKVCNEDAVVSIAAQEAIDQIEAALSAESAVTKSAMEDVP